MTSDKSLSFSELWIPQLEIWYFNATFPDFSNGSLVEDKERAKKVIFIGHLLCARRGTK